MSGYRLRHGGDWIDRGHPLKFTFNGTAIDAWAGDTVASALIAHGVVHTGRSFKLHRPRGIFSCGVEEPTSLLDIGDGAARTPNTLATDIEARDGLVARTGNAWPSLRFDLAALTSKFAPILPAGFYYKTFMWPHWHLFEPIIRRMAGLGAAADEPDPDHYDAVSRHVEVLVIGAGAAGLQAAAAAAKAGRQVLLLEGAARVGGWLASQTWRPGSHAAARLAALAKDVTDSGAELVTRCTAFGLYDHGLVAATQGAVGDASEGVRERLWMIRADRIILATGAYERPMLFPDNDRPGVMLASAVERYASHYGVACGQRVVITTACDSGYGVAHSLHAAGLVVAAIVDHRPAADDEPPDGVPVLRESSIVAVSGSRGVRAVTVARHDGTGGQVLSADCVASAGGWTPAVHLFSMAGGKLRWIDQSAMFVPQGELPGLAVVGACAGAFDLQAALDHARATGLGAPQPAPVGGLGRVVADSRPVTTTRGRANRAGKVFVDLQNDVTTSDVALAARENYRSIEHLKRYTTMGMATDQGKTSNVNALVQMGACTGRAPAEVGTTKFRPPFKPVTLGLLAAGRSADRFRPLKRLPAHDWHAARAALLEDFGGWLRPAAYPRPGEDLAQAAQREALHVRAHVGLFDASPLGKIELYGPDAADFLDLMYVGTMSTLAVGQARYGLLLNENGVIFDDGIVARLGENHFWVNTTSGGVDRVALAFEEWLQCEYVNHRVLVTPVTSQWGNVTLSGPNAWLLLQAAGFDPSLAPAAMKHMTMREIEYGGAAMRVMRASFTGELGYEINLPSLQMPALLDRLWGAGQHLRIQAYGVEALMILRTEKGFLHVGSDTDGTTLPGDVGMDRGVASKAANFVGRRSLLRPAAKEPDRMQLIGLVPLDRRTALAVGAHLAAHKPPAPIHGFVTSSAYSPVLGYPVALAMLERGRQRLGERVMAWHMGQATAAEVVKTPFFDPQGERLNG